jgi:hypothetical protein
MLVPCLAYFWFWRWRWHVPMKSWLTFKGLHGIKSQTIELLKWDAYLLCYLHYLSPWINNSCNYAKNVSFSDNTMMLWFRYWRTHKILSEIYHSTYLVHILSLDFLHILPCKYRQAYGPWSCNLHWVHSCMVLYILLEHRLCLLDSQYRWHILLFLWREAWPYTCHYHC